MGTARSLAVGLVALVVAAITVTSPPAGAVDGPRQTYLVLYKQAFSPGDAATAVSRAGGAVVADYREIGVVVAVSADNAFASRIQRDSRVEGVAATSKFATKVADDAAASGNHGDLPSAPATDGDPLSPLQWDMRQIKAPQAHAVTGGSPSVVVGILDTGVDKDHPDLVDNIDFSKSASCESGAPDRNPAAWDDKNGHGTHTAGTVAAASNGIGIVGTAPNVRLAGIKASNDDGYFLPEMVVCAFMWAGSQRLDVTNNSYFADPYLFNCRNDASQRAIWKAEQRAIRYAMNRGVTVVASAGNESTDLSHPRLDVISPDYPPGNEQEREITNACVVVPVEIPGVIGVSAAGNVRQNSDDPNGGYLKSFYSSYGVSAVDLVAPGGDSLFGRTPEAPNGRVLSTWPAESFCRPDRRMVDPASPGAAYCYLQGTSMAGPHVAGVAALVVSRYGDLSNPQNGKMRPGQVAAHLQQTADDQPCPAALPPAYENFHQTSGEPQTCQGGAGHNSWYGSGHLNALAAVSR